jgi:hypothetical protein
LPEHCLRQFEDEHDDERSGIPEDDDEDEEEFLIREFRG